MISANIAIGTIVYVPFWIVLEYLDTTPPNPFIECVVITIGKRTFQSPAGPIDGYVCDLDLGKDGLIAYSVPVEFVIQKSELNEWATNIAKWFSDFPSTLSKDG